MHEQFRDLEDTLPLILSEDIYLCSLSGDIIAKREQQDNDLTSIYSIFAHSERQFIRKTINVRPSRPFLLLHTERGVALIDRRLSKLLNIITVIIPHCSEIETIAMCSKYLSDMILASEQIEDFPEPIGNIEFTNEHYMFIERLRSTVSADMPYDIDAMTNVEIAEEMLDLAYAYGNLYGCDVDIKFNGLREFDLLRRFSFEMYIFALSVFCAVARNYSAKRNALITAYFRPTGIYLDFSFKIAEIYAERELKSYSTELVKFHEKLFAYKADSEISQADGMINLRIYPFVYKSEYSDIKEKKKKTFKRE